MQDIALIGYGKMGRMVETAAPAKGSNIIAKYDPMIAAYCDPAILHSIDKNTVCIEFTHPGAVMQNIQMAAELGLNIVVGTTGWNDHLQEVQALVSSSGIGLVYGSNFSIGMNLFQRVLEHTVKEFAHFDEYDIYGYELHHRQKADSPSGTAISLSELILKNSEAKNKVCYDRINRKIEGDELHFASIRAGHIPGTHTIGLDSEADTIELIHRVRSRSCFAVGALRAAMWLKGRRGMYSFQEVMTDILC